MVRPDRYVCQSWHVAARVVIQPYLRKSRRNRIKEEEKEEENSEDESEQFETVIPPHSEAPFFTAREDDDYSVTEHSPSVLSEDSQTLQEDVTKGARFPDVSKTLQVDEAPKTRILRMRKKTLDEGSETLIDKVSQTKTLERSTTLVDESSEVSETLVSKASKTLVNNEISSTSLSHTLLPLPATEQFHSVAEDEEDLKLDRTISITLADPRNNPTQLVSLKEDSVTLMGPSSTTIIADTNTLLSNSEKELSECVKIRSGGEGVQFGEALRQVSNSFIIFHLFSFFIFPLRWTSSWKRQSSTLQGKGSTLFQKKRKGKKITVILLSLEQNKKSQEDENLKNLLFPDLLLRRRNHQ